MGFTVIEAAVHLVARIQLRLEGQISRITLKLYELIPFLCFQLRHLKFKAPNSQPLNFKIR